MSYFNQIESAMAFNDVRLTAKSNLLFKSLTDKGFVSIPLKDVPSTFGVRQLSKHFDKGLSKVYSDYCEIHNIPTKNLVCLVVMSYRADESMAGTSGVPVLILALNSIKPDMLEGYTRNL